MYWFISSKTLGLEWENCRNTVISDFQWLQGRQGKKERDGGQIWGECLYVCKWTTQEWKMFYSQIVGGTHTSESGCWVSQRREQTALLHRSQFIIRLRELISQRKIHLFLSKNAKTFHCFNVGLISLWLEEFFCSVGQTKQAAENITLAF